MTNNTNRNRCVDCGRVISKHATRCSACSEKRQDAIRANLAEINAAVAASPVPVLIDSAFGPHAVDYIGADAWVHCHPAAETKSTWNARSFCVCFNVVREIGEKVGVPFRF